MSTQTRTDQAWDGSGHSHELYHATRTADVLAGPEAVDDAAVADYHERGYLAVANVLAPDELATSIEQVERLASGQVEGFTGIQRETNADEGTGSTVTRKLHFARDDVHLSHMPVDHPVITRIASQLMHGRKPIIFQTMALLKPPRIGREKPWHQDHAYFNIALDDRIVGVWIALDRATVENGCMHLLEGGHKDGPILHWKRRDWQICDTQMLGLTSVVAELEPGGALFFDSLLPHGTPTNHSRQQRRAMQFHYAPADHHAIEHEDRMAVFGTEGKDVSC